jgi:membrane protein required for colicin V production
MNLLDVFLIGIVFVSCLSGLRTGFARVVIHLFATFAGLLAAFWCYGIVAARLESYIHQPLAADIAGFCLVFFGIMVLGSLLGFLLARIFQWIGLGWLDHLLGGAAGLVRGALLAAVAVAVLLAFTPAPPPSFISDSRVIPYATSFSGLLAELAPKQIRDGFLEQTEKLKQLWQKNPSKEQRII